MCSIQDKFLERWYVSGVCAFGFAHPALSSNRRFPEIYYISVLYDKEKKKKQKKMKAKINHKTFTKCGKEKWRLQQTNIYRPGTH